MLYPVGRGVKRLTEQQLPLGKPLPPSTLAGQQNGMIPLALLGPVDSLSLGRLMEARHVAPAMRALHAAALRNGFELSSTGRYRPLQAQWDYFGGRSGRYQPCTEADYVQRRKEDKAARRKNTTKVWPTARRNRVIELLGPQTHPIPNETYWLLTNPKSLNAAVPGTSNHGQAISNDLAEVITTRFTRRRKVVSLSKACRAWLYTVIVRYGFAWETPNDPPHVTWIMGDELPPALGDTDMAQRVRADGDTAELLLSGVDVVWVRDGNVSAALEKVHGPLITCPRLAFAMYHGTGPFPNSTLKPTDFASWVEQ